jgi:hypothetical protein
VACKTCPAGTYFIDNGCRTCPAQSYCPNGFIKLTCSNTASTPKYVSYDNPSVACVECGAGNYIETNYTGSTVSTIRCRKCAAGFYSAVGGLTACTDCPRSTYQADQSSTMCRTCDPGFYNLGTGATVCNVCELGHYCSMGERNYCMNYTYRDKMGSSTPCDVCDSGTYATGQGEI